MNLGSHKHSEPEAILDERGDYIRLLMSLRRRDAERKAPCEERHTGKMTESNNRGREWSDVGAHQGRPRIGHHPQKLEESRKPSPLEASEGAGPANTLISDVWPSELEKNKE